MNNSLSGLEIASLIIGICASLYAMSQHETASDRRLKRALADALARRNA